METFKIRAHASGIIMTGIIGLTEKQSEKLLLLESKEKRTDKQEEEYQELTLKKQNPDLPQTIKSYCKEWLTEKMYGYRKEIKNRYLDKGSIMEDDAIDLAINLLNLPFVMKNTLSFEDEFFTGTPDIIIDELDRVDDTKCSWDCFTFPLFEEEIPNMDYFYQLQVYMHLTGKKHASLDYVLLNTPEYLDYGEPKTYDHLDKKFRIRNYLIEYDESVILELQKRVILCKEYINSLLKKIKKIKL